MRGGRPFAELFLSEFLDTMLEEGASAASRE